jgi:putative membrane protein
VNGIPEPIARLQRPNPSLWTYYVIRALLTGPGFLVLLPYLFFRYRTLRYAFDEQGIHMRVGILFRKEVNVTYARIQDIHLSAGLLQRWLGLADVQIQTASGSAKPELVIEGFQEFEIIRDFLYTRMRGYAGKTGSITVPQGPPPLPHDELAPLGIDLEMVKLLHGIRDELRLTRQLLQAGGTSRLQPPAPPTDV